MPTKPQSTASNANEGARLSWGDALFLYLERAGMPLIIASVSIFEGDIELEACRRYIESKLPLLPRYRQHALAPPFNVGLPSWEEDSEFDIRNHIKERHLKQGTEAELQAVAGEILSTVMDRSHPLWDITLLHGLKGDRMGMLVRVHHCLADGVAGVALVNVLFDASPKVRPISRSKKKHPVKRQRDSLTLLLEGCISSCTDVLNRAVTAQDALVNALGSTVATGLPSANAASFLPELTAPTQRLFFNQVYKGPQAFAWTQIPTDDIKTIRRSCGGTHNDVVLALMTATMRRYAERHGDHVKGRLFRMMVPVNVRVDDATEMGNRILFLPVTVPLDVTNSRKLLESVNQRTEYLKRTHLAEWLGLAATVIGVVPPSIQALLGPLASMLPLALCNMICTNIRGPEGPLYLLGHKMTDWYPYVPIGGEMTLNCAILSYRGITYFGFSGDTSAATDMHELPGLLQQSARELLKAAGASISKAKKPRRKAAQKTVAATADEVLPAEGTSAIKAATTNRRRFENAHVMATSSAAD